jgi:sodium/potassium/calcium exchanger 6
MLECTYENIRDNYADACNFVKNCQYSYFNLFEIHFCAFNGIGWITFPVLFLLGALFFYLLGDTSNRYLSVSLTKISDKINFSQSFSALTFLAFGNGAPDIFSGIVASESAGIDFTMGALMGAGVFLTSFVISIVIVFAKKVEVDGVMFNRDIILSFMTLLLLSYFSYKGSITFWESCLIFAIYFIYLIVAVIQDKCSNKSNDKIDLVQEGINLLFYNR